MNPPQLNKCRSQTNTRRAAGKEHQRRREEGGDLKNINMRGERNEGRSPF
jgi:hypothetical protein